MFRRKEDVQQTPAQPPERITSVLGDGVNLRGTLTGSGGIRIEGAFDGDVDLNGLLVVGPTGRVTCPQLRAKTIIIAGALKGNILAEKVEIRSSGRVWGDVVTVAMSTEEGAFLRGQIQMEEKIDWGDAAAGGKPEPEEEPAAEEEKPEKKKPKAKRGKKKQEDKD